jgi:hypothetical protein
MSLTGYVRDTYKNRSLERCEGSHAGNNRLHVDSRLLALAPRIETCRAWCPTKALPIGHTTGCFYRN